MLSIRPQTESLLRRYYSGQLRAELEAPSSMGSVLHALERGAPGPSTTRRPEMPPHRLDAARILIDVEASLHRLSLAQSAIMKAHFGYTRRPPGKNPTGYALDAVGGGSALRSEAAVARWRADPERGGRALERWLMDLVSEAQSPEPTPPEGRKAKQRDQWRAKRERWLAACVAAEAIRHDVEAKLAVALRAYEQRCDPEQRPEKATYSARQIAAALELSPPTVCTRLNEKGVPRQGRIVARGLGFRIRLSDLETHWPEAAKALISAASRVAA